MPNDIFESGKVILFKPQRCRLTHEKTAFCSAKGGVFQCEQPYLAHKPATSHTSTDHKGFPFTCFTKSKCKDLLLHHVTVCVVIKHFYCHKVTWLAMQG